MTDGLYFSVTRIKYVAKKHIILQFVLCSLFELNKVKKYEGRVCQKLYNIIVDRYDYESCWKPGEKVE